MATNKYKHSENWLSNFEENTNLLHRGENGIIENPYKHLPTIDLQENAEKVNKAMQAYEDILFGISKRQSELKKSLLSRFITLLQTGYACHGYYLRALEELVEPTIYHCQRQNSYYPLYGIL